MPELRTLLHEAAPRPLRPLDVESLVHRARRTLRWRIAACGATLAVAILAAPATTPLFATDRPAEVVVDDGSGPAPAPDRTEGSPRVERSVETGVLPPDPIENGRRADDIAASSAGPTPPVRPGLPGEAGRPAADSAATTPNGASNTFEPDAGDPFHPHRVDCSVDTTLMWAEETRECRFTAIGHGGAGFRGPDAWTAQDLDNFDAVVVVRRDGVVVHEWRRPGQRDGLAVFVGEAGMATGCPTTTGYEQRFIEPGDQVHVSLTKIDDDQTPALEFGAGEGWECGS